MSAPVLVFGWGNPSRGDDALGPLFVEAVEAMKLPGIECLTDFQLQVEHALDLRRRSRILFVDAVEAMKLPGVECLTDFQLQVEHALDLRGRERVLFVDASADAAAPFTFERIEPARDASFTTHAVSPQAILQVFREVEAEPAPPCWLLAIRGEGWELGAPTSATAQENLRAAIAWSRTWLAQG